MSDERVIAKHLVRQGDLANRSGTITTGGAPQQLLAANADRRYLLVQNPSANAVALWVAFGQAAVTASPSIELPPGMGIVFEGAFVPTAAVSVVSTTTGLAYTA